MLWVWFINNAGDLQPVFHGIYFTKWHLNINSEQLASFLLLFTLSLQFCIMMFTNFYIARPTYSFILMYNCGLTVVIKRICYFVLFLSLHSSFTLYLCINVKDMFNDLYAISASAVCFLFFILFVNFLLHFCVVQ